MKLTIVKIAIVLFVLPVMLAVISGCNNEYWPEDKWPVITHYETSENFTVNLEILKGYGIPRIDIPDRQVDMKIQVRSYHATQPYTVRVFLENVDQTITGYTNNLPVGDSTYRLPTAASWVKEGVDGTYIDGNPPQGTAELDTFFVVDPAFFPTSIDDWVRFIIDPFTGDLILDSVTARYIFHFRVLIEDADGRSDTFTFDAISTLNVKTDNENN